MANALTIFVEWCVCLTIFVAEAYHRRLMCTLQVKGKPPPCSKHVTAELGCVTPYIVVPGKWTHADLVYYANEVVAGLVNNAGHNCTKVEVLVTDGAWPQRKEFVDLLRCACSLWHTCIHNAVCRTCQNPIQ